jgi:FdhD protein
MDLSGCFLAVSGRLPADMVYKAIGARIPLMASVSAATANGVDAAVRGGITLIGFAREGRMNVYSVPERILGYAGN